MFELDDIKNMPTIMNETNELASSKPPVNLENTLEKPQEEESIVFILEKKESDKKSV